MKQYVIIATLAMASGAVKAQPWPRQERYILDGNKRMTDAGVSLFNVHSDYKFPYIIPTKADVTEKLLRVLDMLERSTADAIVDAATGERVTDMSRIPQQIAIAQGDFRPFSYEWGVTYSGMTAAAEATGERRFAEYATRRMKLLADALPEIDRRLKADKNYRSPFNALLAPQNLDQCGAMCAAMARSSEQKVLRPYIDRMAEFIISSQYRLPDRTLARNEPYHNTLWLDDLYMSVPALAQMYRLTGERRWADDAARQIVQFAARMFIGETGLFMHSWVESMNPHPHLCWGRANGWATLAMCDLLDALPANHPQRAAVLERFRAHCLGLARCQSGEGLWHQLLDRNDSYLETSATAMFVYGLAHGINMGWLDARAFGPAALLGWNALASEINGDGLLEKICVGTGVSYEPAYYYYRHVHPYAAHGYGPLMMAGAGIIKLVENFDVKQSTAIYFGERRKN